MKTVWVVVLVLAGLVGLIVAAGFMLPRQTSATRTATIAAPPEKVFALVTQVGGQAAWRRDVASVTVSADGRAWTETARNGVAIEFTETAREENRLFRLTFRSSQGFSGAWEGRFEPAGEGTSVTFTETVEVPNPIFRLLGRLFDFTGQHMDAYLADLTKAAAAPAPAP